MDKDRIEGSAKAIKGRIKEVSGKSSAMPSWSPTARPARRREGSRTLSAVSKTRSRGNNFYGDVLVARNAMLRTVARNSAGNLKDRY